MKKTVLILLVLMGFGRVTSSLGQCTTITQPDTALLCPATGSTTMVSVATDAVAPTYQWQYRVIKASNLNPAWITITAANAGAVYTNYTTSNLGVTRVNSVSPAVGTQYRVIVGGGSCGAITSNSANLILLDAVKAGTIVSAPSVCTGGDISFQVSGYIGTSLQWVSASSSAGDYTPIPGATVDTFTLTGANSTTNRYYKVLVTDDACGTVAMTSSKLLKVDALSVAGIVTGGGTMCPNSSTTLQLTGAVGSIQWESSKDGVEFDKAPVAVDNTPSNSFQTTSVSNTLSTYVVGNLYAPTYFRAKVTSGLCSKTYTNVVTCIPGTVAESSGISPASSAICRGTGTTLTVVANGALTWEKSTNYSGATPTWTPTTNHTNTLNTGNLTVPTAYRVRVSVGTCSESSSIYTNVAVVSILPQAVSKPTTANVTVPSGKTAATALCTSDASKVLTVGAGYAGDIQWQVSTTSTSSGFTDIAGETSSTYTVTAPAAGVNYYRVKFTNSCGASVYNTATTLYYTDCVTGKVAAVTEQAPKLVVYPNPYTEAFTIDVSRFKEAPLQIMVHDVMGRLIERQEAYPSTLSDRTFGTTYPTGIYMITITQNEITTTERIVRR